VRERTLREGAPELDMERVKETIKILLEKKKEGRKARGRIENRRVQICGTFQIDEILMIR
jgi:hypothetical protein